jgi:hypothetical protein
LTVVLLANSDGLSAKFPLAAGDVMVSPFAATFLRIFSNLWKTANAQGWFVSPSVGMTFKTKTGFIDLDDAASVSKPVITMSGGRMARHLGFEAEASWLPDFFSGHTGLVTNSRVVTTTAHAIFQLPRGRLPVRPYATIGGGAMFVHIEDVGDVFTSSSVLKTAVVGGGVLIPIKKRKWTSRADLRYVRSEYAKPQPSIPLIDARSLSFWRASVGMVFGF